MQIEIGDLGQIGFGCISYKCDNKEYLEYLEFFQLNIQLRKFCFELGLGS